VVDVNWYAAFSAGFISFFAPCILPLVPSFLIYISGATIKDYSDFEDKSLRRRVLLHSVFFIAGFSLVFITLGLSSSFLGSLFAVYQKWIMAVGGLVLIVMGLNMLGLLKIPFLNREKTVHVKGKAGGFLGSVLVGVTFSLGWTPCIGPVLASILIISATGKSVWSGFYLLGLYSLGLAIPFFLAALFVGRLMHFMQRFGHVVRYASLVLGGLLIVLGLLLVTGIFTAVTSLLG
jgi:cytochrome c-type biogenesis protein